jgi:pimeloyl-ACP methyl ester carboxylesterase
MDKPRLLCVPLMTELEWQIKPQLSEWAEVIAYDAPGIGGDPGEWTPQGVAERGLALADERGWERFVLLADGTGGANASRILRSRPEAIQGVALGHATLSNRTSGDRAPVNGAVVDGMRTLIAQDASNFISFGIVQMTQDGYDEDLAKEMIGKVPRELLPKIVDVMLDEYDIEAELRDLDVPLLFAKHEGCLVYTDEGFADAAGAFPDARTLAMPETCSVSPEFADALREFCAAL